MRPTVFETLPCLLYFMSMYILSAVSYTSILLAFLDSRSSDSVIILNCFLCIGSSLVLHYLQASFYPHSRLKPHESIAKSLRLPCPVPPYQAVMLFPSFNQSHLSPSPTFSCGPSSAYSWALASALILQPGLDDSHETNFSHEICQCPSLRTLHSPSPFYLGPLTSIHHPHICEVVSCYMLPGPFLFLFTYLTQHASHTPPHVDAALPCLSFSQDSH